LPSTCCSTAPGKSISIRSRHSRWCGGVERVAALLRDDPRLARTRDDNGRPLAFRLHPEMTRLDEMIRLLVTHGVDLNARDNGGKTLLDCALAHGFADFATMLRAHGATM
jgi:ankyrin repeat protein